MKRNTFGRWVVLAVIAILGSQLAGLGTADARGRRHTARSPEKIEGIVISVSADELVIRTGDADVAVILTPETRIEHPVEVSTQVEVKAVPNADGRLVAVSIESERDVLEIKGVIRALSDAGFVLTNGRGEVRVTTDDRTIVVVEGVVATLADLAVGDHVEIHALPLDDGSVLALLVVAESENIELHGVITALTDGSMTIHSARGEVEVALTPDTVVRVYGREGTLADLRIGMHVEVDTNRLADGSLVANVIEVENDFDMIEINGVVTAVDDAGMTVLSRHGEEVSLTFLPDTIVMRGDERLTVADINAGDRVEVKARRTGDGALAVVRIRIEDGEHDLREIEGVIEGFEGSLLTITTRSGRSVSVMVDSETVIRIEREEGSVADLVPGRKVEIHVRINADGSLTAVAIKVETENHDDDEFEIEGMVTALTDSSISVRTRHVGEVVFAVTHDTIVMRGDAVVAFSEIVVGDHVEIHAESDGAGGLTAIRIKIESDDHQEMEFEGEVIAVSSTSITVMTERRGAMTFEVTDRTEVTIGDRHASIGEVVVGDKAEVKARMGDGGMIAERIEVEREHD